eukprot:362057-Chlamydomonas_euryale.AAC.15
MRSGATAGSMAHCGEPSTSCAGSASSRGVDTLELFRLADTDSDGVVDRRGAHALLALSGLKPDAIEEVCTAAAQRRGTTRAHACKRGGLTTGQPTRLRLWRHLHARPCPLIHPLRPWTACDSFPPQILEITADEGKLTVSQFPVALRLAALAQVGRQGVGSCLRGSSEGPADACSTARKQATKVWGAKQAVQTRAWQRVWQQCVRLQHGMQRGQGVLRACLRCGVA